MNKLLSLSEILENKEISSGDVFNLALDEEISILVDMEYINTSVFVDVNFSCNKSDLEEWLKVSYIKKGGVKYLTNLSSFNEEISDDLSCWFDGAKDIIVHEKVILNEKNISFFNAELHGYWKVNKFFIKKALILNSIPSFEASHLSPVGDLNNLNFLLVSSKNNQVYRVDDLYISHDDFNKLYNFNLDKGYVSNKRLYSYQPQQQAQSVRHAINREKVLMAAISINKRYPNECSKNPTRWGELLWEKRTEYWPDEKPPLTKDEIIKLLRKAVKSPI
ncbi:hypothetical protein BV924_02600 [Pectobacterium odoriferum]|uniref:HNH nuclease domain-containing protein n=1 Tax=Pectobacterium odoriferum TaxID=78398 RepID=A0ABD6VVI8_9GAMM|nr:hypothetical protein [Pectobacterium odoriferum]POD96809.1 hypothetical protein BVY06_05650 [Pectobacterium odoriferum]POE15679.1 hypothetical protein BV924_02600 [Pectobacterium odoriferum]POE29217.1 hypothetical protein BV926_02595 [Pectobacterium odoriferum]POE34566.1 hypothetical protein BV919_02595 [Pectobacterium odoriferum]